MLCKILISKTKRDLLTQAKHGVYGQQKAQFVPLRVTLFLKLPFAYTPLIFYSRASRTVFLALQELNWQIPSMTILSFVHQKRIFPQISAK